MNNNIMSNKRTLMAAATLSAIIMLASAPLLVPTTRAFAQDPEAIVSSVISKNNEVLSGLNADSDESEEQGSSEDETAAAATADEEQGSSEDETAAAATADEEQGSSEEAASSLSNRPNSQVNIDAEEQEEISTVEADDLVTVDPITQVSVMSDVNVNSDNAVVLDAEDCEDATNESTQANGQGSNQIAGSAGEVGDNSMYISPKLQMSQKLALNINVDTDLVLAEGCNPQEDTVTQANVQQSGQGVGNDLEASSEGSTTSVPVKQTSDNTAENISVNRDVVLPVL